MTTQTAPTAASDLFAESYKLSPKQREVLDALQTFPDGARAIDVAKNSTFTSTPPAATSKNS